MHALGMRLYIFDSRKTRTTPITTDRQFLNSTSTSTINLSFKRVTLVQEHDIYQCELTTVELTNKPASLELANFMSINIICKHMKN